MATLKFSDVKIGDTVHFNDKREKLTLKITGYERKWGEIVGIYAKYKRIDTVLLKSDFAKGWITSASRVKKKAPAKKKKATKKVATHRPR